MDPVAGRIAKIIDKKGYSYAAFAKAIGLQRANISHVLSGRNRPSLEMVQRILRTFPDVDSEELLFGASPNREGGETKDPAVEEKLAVTGANKKVERVVICYEDGTFASYERDV